MHTRIATAAFAGALATTMSLGGMTVAHAQTGEQAEPTAEVIASQQGLSKEIAAFEQEYLQLSTRDYRARYGKEWADYLSGYVEAENNLLTRVKELAARAEKTEDTQRLAALTTNIEQLLAADLRDLDAAKKSMLSSYPGSDVLHKLGTMFAPLDEIITRLTGR